jgi:2-oxoglutarate ferredoxin oxidoreductase subunit gamma
MYPLEIQFAGFGGQGVVLAGMALGRGLVLHEDRHVSLTQSFGPEARGSSCSVQLVVSDQPVLYPYLSHPHILVAMSQDAFRKFAPALRPGGLLLIEEDLVQADPAQLPAGVRLFSVPATRLAEELGRKLVLNMVMLGCLNAVAGLLRAESLRQAVAGAVPRGTEKLNLAALDKGFQYGSQWPTAA